MRCQNLNCDRSEGLGYRMVQTELGCLCSICYSARNNGILEGIKIADKTVEAVWEKSKNKMGEILRRAK